MIQTRPAEPRDRSFVVEAWLDSFRTAYTGGMIAMSRWASVMRVEIEDVLNRPAQVIVAHEDSDPDPIADLLGFIAYETPASLASPYVFYVYVKQPYRKQGIARALFAAAGIEPRRPFSYACSTRKVRELAAKIPLARWQPLIARFAPGAPRSRYE